MKKFILALLILSSPLQAASLTTNLTDRCNSTLFRVQVVREKFGKDFVGADLAALPKLKIAEGALAASAAGLFLAGSALSIQALPGDLKGVSLSGKSAIPDATSYHLAAGASFAGAFMLGGSSLALGKKIKNHRQALNQSGAENYSKSAAEAAANLLDLTPNQKNQVKDAIMADIREKYTRYKTALDAGKKPDEAMPNPVEIILGMKLLDEKEKNTLRSIQNTIDRATNSPVSDAELYSCVKNGNAILQKAAKNSTEKDATLDRTIGLNESAIKIADTARAMHQVEGEAATSDNIDHSDNDTTAPAE